MLYCSTSLALAVLEVLVHTDKTAMPENYVWSRAEVGELTWLDLHMRHIHDEQYTRNLGGAWIQSRRAVGTLVPSLIVPAEWNALLNPLHAEYELLPWEPPIPFRFDARLF